MFSRDCCTRIQWWAVEYVTKTLSQKTTTGNLTALAMATKPRDAGKKPNKRQRYRQKQAESTILTTIKRLHTTLPNSSSSTSWQTVQSTSDNVHGSVQSSSPYVPQSFQMTAPSQGTFNASSNVQQFKPATHYYALDSSTTVLQPFQQTSSLQALSATTYPPFLITAQSQGNWNSLSKLQPLAVQTSNACFSLRFISYSISIFSNDSTIAKYIKR